VLKDWRDSVSAPRHTLPAKGDFVQDTRLRERSGEAGVRTTSRLFGPDSVAWLIVVSALFVLSELLPALLRLPLGADEMTYIARTSAHASGVFLPPVHGHAAGFLAAPVTLATTSLTALRVWMSVLSGLGLLGSLLCWRGLRPAWVLALAGLLFASLAITQLSGVQVYPDLWTALAMLAITGLLLQSVQGRMKPWVVIGLIAFLSFFLVLLRPQNIVFALAPTFVAPLVVRGWRQRSVRVLIAMIVGIAAGVVEWAAESSLWFGGLASRIGFARQEPPPLSLNFSLPMQIKVLSGPWYCQTAQGCPYNNYPGLLFWWLAFAALVALGVYAVWRRPEKASSVLLLVTGAWSAALYILFVPFGAPRYMLPTLALFAILAADGIRWLATVPSWRRAGIGLACVFLLTGAVSQHFVLTRETANQATIRKGFEATAADLRAHGIKPPCVLSSPSPAYILGCTAPWSVDRGRPARKALRFVLAHAYPGTGIWHEVYTGIPGEKYVWVRD
jgi:hypothetical protein